MAKEKPDYLSYLLRVWQVGGDQKSHGGDEQSRRLEKPIWRASLESSHIRGRKVFGTLDDLFSFLREQTHQQVECTLREEPHYRSYLLRLWRASDDAEPRPAVETAAWRASIESVPTGERRDFASLDELFDFVREQTGAQPAPDRGDASSRRR